MQNQESCVITGGKTTNYFKLKRCNQISAYLFILTSEIAFLFIMQNENINGINIFEKIHRVCRYYYVFS